MIRRKSVPMDANRRQTLLDAFSALAEELRAQGVQEEELLGVIRGLGDGIPATAFATNLTPFETASRWLLEHGRDEEEIAHIVGRSPSVVRKTLANSNTKHPERLQAAQTDYGVPAPLFGDKRYTFSEHVCMHLKRRYALTNTQIARTIGLDPRTVWTVLHRAEKKGGEKHA